MPISHKIRQYRALFGVHALGRNSPVHRVGAGEVVPSREYGRLLYTKILIGSPRGLGIGLLEQSHETSLVVTDIPTHPRIRGGLRLPGRYPRSP